MPHKNYVGISNLSCAFTHPFNYPKVKRNITISVQVLMKVLCNFLRPLVTASLFFLSPNIYIDVFLCVLMFEEKKFELSERMSRPLSGSCRSEGPLTEKQKRLLHDVVDTYQHGKETMLCYVTVT